MPSALITGANRGLGLEFARQYLAEGWQVYAGCRDPDSAFELRRLTDTSDDQLRIMTLDVTDSATIKAAVSELDGQAIDLLLNNAGVMDLVARPSVTSTTMPGQRCSTPTPWARCGFQRRSSTISPAATESSSSPLLAAWDRLPTIRLAARSLIKGCGEHGDAQFGH